MFPCHISFYYRFLPPRHSHFSPHSLWSFSFQRFFILGEFSCIISLSCYLRFIFLDHLLCGTSWIEPVHFLFLSQCPSLFFLLFLADLFYPPSFQLIFNFWSSYFHFSREFTLLCYCSLFYQCLLNYYLLTASSKNIYKRYKYPQSVLLLFCVVLRALCLELCLSCWKLSSVFY